MGEINLGKVKVWIEVANWYYGKVWQMITAFGVLKLNGVAWWVLAIIFFGSIPLVVLIVYLHMTYVYPKEVEYTWNKNPAYKKLLEDKDG